MSVFLNPHILSIKPGIGSINRFLSALNTLVHPAPLFEKIIPRLAEDELTSSNLLQTFEFSLHSIYRVFVEADSDRNFKEVENYQLTQKELYEYLGSVDIHLSHRYIPAKQIKPW